MKTWGAGLALSLTLASNAWAQPPRFTGADIGGPPAGACVTRSGSSSARTTSFRPTTTARSIAFWSSRTLPGQG